VDMKPSLSYRDAGVDIDAGNRLVSMIRSPLAATRRAGVMGDIGGFGALFDLKACRYRDPLLVSSTDGVGTKLKLAFLTGRHGTVGIDLVAMSVNDLVVQGAEPLFFLDYFATGRLDPAIAATVIAGIADGCRQAGCALVGGETAEMPDFYPDGEYDLAGFAVGAVERDQVIDGQTIVPGDQVLGLASSGPHANGYSLIRRIVLGTGDDRTGPHGLTLDTPMDGGGTLADALLAPTRIYVKSLLDVMAHHPVRGLVHITGGGFWDNIPRVLPASTRVRIDARSWTRPEVFVRLQQAGGVTEYEMLRTFNCGIGMVMVVPAAGVEAVMQRLQASGETCYRIGEVLERHGEEEQVEVQP
jgi:phosphoribosylformylglycinamidine cyclo-ligase